jgi:hypothetical protein
MCLGSSSGCGTIIYPERRGQKGGKLDAGVVLLDGLGLLLFFVPGVIAFIVDFCTGAIYLPEEPVNLQKVSEHGRSQSGKEAPETRWVKVDVPREKLSRDYIAQVVSKHAGRSVRLVEGSYRTESLKSIGDFWTAVDRLARRKSRPCDQAAGADNTL